MQIINFYQKIEEPLSVFLNQLESIQFFGALLKLICTFKSLTHAILIQFIINIYFA